MNNLTTTKQKSLAQQDKKETFSMFITKDAIKNQINAIVGGKNGQRFISSIISAVSTNSALTECTHTSILSSALLGESLNLSPSPQLGQYYMVPFKNKKEGTSTATFVLGYKGYIQLAIRSGYYKKINVLAIKEGELVKFNPLDEEIKVNLIEDDEQREITPTTGYYAMFEYENGFRKTMYWSKKKMLAHADKYSAAFDVKAMEKIQQGKMPESEMWKYSSFWYKDFDGMAYKTLLRQLISKWGIMSIEMQTAFEADAHAIKEDLTPGFVGAEEVEKDKQNEQDTQNEEHIIIEERKNEDDETKDPFDEN